MFILTKYFDNFLNFFHKTGNFLNTIFIELLNKRDEFIFIFILKKILKSLNFRNILFEVFPNSFKTIYNYVTKLLSECSGLNNDCVNFRFILIYSLENFDKYDQKILKTLMDKYSKTLRFFFFCKKTANVSESILNRSIYFQLSVQDHVFKNFFSFSRAFFRNFNIDFISTKKNISNKKFFLANIFSYFYFFICSYIKSKSRNFFSKKKILNNEYFILMLEFFRFSVIRNHIEIYDKKFINRYSSLTLIYTIDYFFLLKQMNFCIKK